MTRRLAKPLPTQQRLRELFTYCPQSGNLIRRMMTSNRTSIGEVAGSVDCEGYRYVGLDGERFAAHRLIFVHQMGDILSPTDVVDHINHAMPADNRIENLRVGSSSQNQCNRRRQSNNSSGYKGVSRHKNYDGSYKWAAQLSVSGERQFYKVYSTPIEAARAYDQAALKYHGDYAMTNFPSISSE